MKHHIKLNENFADAVYSGEKCFEIRDNDRGYQKGDTVQFKVMSDNLYGVSAPHPLNNVEFEITYVLNGWGLKEGFVVFSIKRKEINND